MRKNVLRIFSLLLIIVVLLMAVSCDTGVLLSDYMHESKCTLIPEHCQSVFGCTPEEFFDLELDIYKTVEDLRNDASISSDGDLILIFTKSQRLALMNSELFDYSEYPNIEVSYEDRYVIVNGFAETVYEDTKASLEIADKVCMYLMLQNKPGTEIVVDYIIQDGVTGKTYYSMTWPQQEWHISLNEYNFSPLPE